MPVTTASEGVEGGETLTPTGQQTLTMPMHTHRCVLVPRHVALFSRWSGPLHHNHIAPSKQSTCLCYRRFGMEAAGTFHHLPHAFLLAINRSRWIRASPASPSALTTGCQHPPLGCERSQSGFSELSFFGTKDSPAR